MSTTESDESMQSAAYSGVEDRNGGGPNSGGDDSPPEIDLSRMGVAGAISFMLGFGPLLMLAITGEMSLAAVALATTGAAAGAKLRGTRSRFRKLVRHPGLFALGEVTAGMVAVILYIVVPGVVPL